MAYTYGELKQLHRRSVSDQIEQLDAVICKKFIANFTPNDTFRFDFHTDTPRECIQGVATLWREKGWIVNVGTYKTDTHYLLVDRRDEYCLSPKGVSLSLNEEIKLSIWQKIALGAFYANNGVTPFPTRENENVFEELTSAFLNDLISKSTVTNSIRHFRQPTSRAIFTMGRRSGCSLLACVAALQEVISVQSIYDPQANYSLMDADDINIMVISSCEINSKTCIFEKLAQITEDIGLGCVVNSKNKTLRLKTQKDCDLGRDGTIVIRAVSANSHELLRNAKAIIADDAYEYLPLLERLLPSVACYGDDGHFIAFGHEGRSEHEWRDFVDSWLDSDPNLLHLCLPTELMNPLVEREYLKQEKRRNPDSFARIFGARI